MDRNLADFFDNPDINSRIFYPRKIEKPTQPIDNVHFIELSLTTSVKIGAVLYQQDVKLPTIILFHGNGEIATDYSYGVRQFFDIGVNLMVIDFRGYGFSTGEPTYNHLIGDAMPSFDLAIKWLNSHGFSRENFLMGRSLGSVCAAEIGSKNPASLRGVIFESGYADTLDLMKTLFMINLSGISQSTIAPWSNLPRIGKIQHPTLVIHGTKDMIVPYQQGLLIHKSLPESTPKKFVSIEGAGHNDIQLFHQPYFQAFQDFISKGIKKE